ncbi:hairy/enhancer-of-split related with YRPW motif protein 2 [Esox lucius]|uniref:Hairy/enhancer-of-split related with YRPW motif protein 2 n=2 Tax=Esox lucius TaxID=8010 RepID=A0A3P9AH98_ESOLU|nr:hairy/enhancer-of-split related with YRPW motif protein 2 [Esox lucius]
MVAVECCPVCVLSVCIPVNSFSRFSQLAGVLNSTKLGRVNCQGSLVQREGKNLYSLLSGSGRVFSAVGVPKQDVGGNAPCIGLRLQQFVGKRYRGNCLGTSEVYLDAHPSTETHALAITMKRPCEDSTSDSDMDETIDVGSENNYSGHSNGSFIRCGSPTTTTQVMARKKRRGIIEKRRRDRINNSLSELRRLVPTAFEKQGSAKLEKAEILQMTVDHLKMLQATGGKGYFDAHALAMDFMSVGFRECLTEVARYLSSVEGLDSSDPLRVRLVSHLSTCASQREAAAMTSSMAHHQQTLHPHHWAAFHPLPATFLQQGGLPSPDGTAGRLSVEVPQRGSALLTATFSHTDSSHRAPSGGGGAPCVPPISTSLLSLSATVHAAAAAAAAAQTFPLSFPGGFPIFTPHSGGGTASMVATAVSPSATPTSQHSRDRESSSNKPYRPWGTEVGAF